ncbi:endothelin-converting enzyme 2-like [Biomphalaria glabrata]|uniref:Endothelin-converting enzyme 2-like n=1 Tax=Biomphalaria glabrata TaxID=6526 RepID=A0A9W2ZQF7_BIOGL|nr:endothelin-converting enzyme 2-like [Biomphalaria glabrata]
MSSLKMWIVFALLSYHVTCAIGFYLAQNNKQTACQTDECINTSQQIASMMDTSVDPCEDMYQFSCGGWLRNNPLPEKQSRWIVMDTMKSKINEQLIQLLQSDDVTFKGHNSTAIRKLKILYKTCLDTDSIESQGFKPLTKLIDDLGSWTVSPTPGGWDRQKWSLQKALEKSHYLWGTSLWSTYIYKDAKNGSRNILHIKQSGLLDADHLSTYDTPEFKALFVNATSSLGVALGGQEETARTKMDQVFEFEKKLSKIFIPKEELVNPFKSYNKMTLREFQTLLGSWIDIEKFFTAIAGQNFLTQDDDIIVETPKYFQKLKNVILKTEKEVLANYITYNFILAAHDYFPSKESSFIKRIAKEERSVSTGNPRASKCVELSTNQMGFAVSALYVENHFSTENLAKVAIILDDIEHQFVQNLHVTDWIDSQTKLKLIQKAKSMTNQIGHPDWITDPIKLDKEFEDLDVVEGELLENYVRIARFKADKEIQAYRRAPKETWHAYPHAVNAYYVAQDNEITVLAGILQEPVVSPSYPDAYMYGSIGMILGHELIHGFDDSGRLYDAIGNLKETWSTGAAKKFESRSKCLIKQFDSYTVQGKNLSGLLTLGENIADNGGVKLAYRAYKDGIKSKHSLPNLNLTEDQLYFVGMSQFWCGHYDAEYEIQSIRSDSHAHSRYRVLGSMANSRDFARAFKCSEKSTLNPKNKCSVW